MTDLVKGPDVMSYLQRQKPATRLKTEGEVIRMWTNMKRGLGVRTLGVYAARSS